MKLATTDLEQIEQFKKLYIQLGAGMKQIETLEAKIALSELAQEQKMLGISIDTEDVDALHGQLIVSMKSLRNRASHFVQELMDISKRAGKPSKAKKQNPAPEPKEPKKVAEAPKNGVSEATIDDAPEIPEDDGEIIMEV